jgi:hypothetical protein
VGRFYGDGAYDPWGVRGQLKKRGIEQVIPPRKDAVIKGWTEKIGQKMVINKVNFFPFFSVD